MAGAVLEAPHLVVLGEQVADGVIHQVDEAVGASGGDAGHVTDRHLEDVAAWLLPHPLDHVRRLLDAVHADARPGQRQGDPAGAQGELQRVALAREPGQAAVERSSIHCA